MPRTVKKAARASPTDGQGALANPENSDNNHRKRGRRSMAEMRAAEQTGRSLSQRPVKPSTSPNLPTSLGSRIKLVRMRLALSQQELAGEKYVASYISAIERDKIQPSLKALELIAQRLNEPVEYFLYGGYGSGVLQDAGLNANERKRPPPETSFSLAVRDKLMEVQTLLETGIYWGDKEGQANFTQARTLLEGLPGHQLTEFDRAQVALLVVRLHLLQGSTLEIPALVEEAIFLARRTQQPDLEIELNFLLGQFYFSQHELEPAIIYHKTAHDLVENFRDQLAPELPLQVLSALVTAYLAAGDGAQAVEIFEETLRLEEYYAKPQVRARLYTKLANLYRDKGDLDRTRKFSKLALIIYEQLNLRRNLLRLSAEVGETLIISNKLADAEKILLRTTGVSSQNLDLMGSDLALAYNSLVALRIQQNDLEEASRISQLGIEEAHKAGDPLVEGKALRLAADIADRLHQPAEARLLYEHSITMLENSQTHYALGDIYKAYGEALTNWGDFETAVIYLKKAYDSKR